MSTPTKKISVIASIAVIIIGTILLSLAWNMRGDSSKPKPQQAYVEEKPAEQPDPPPTPTPESKQNDELPLYTSTAADAVFGAFDTATWMCYDQASKTYFVYFESVKSEDKEFGYVKGWNIMGSYSFIVLGNGTAALKSAGNFSPIAFETNGLDCRQRWKE